jgi:superfamily II DNA or RNA helicase
MARLRARRHERLLLSSVLDEFVALSNMEVGSKSALLRHETGVLSAGTAFGKTVVAAWMVAARKTNTLILVHRRQLLYQWRERLSIFLNLPLKSIGQLVRVAGG